MYLFEIVFNVQFQAFCSCTYCEVYEPHTWYLLKLTVFAYHKVLTYTDFKQIFENLRVQRN